MQEAAESGLDLTFPKEYLQRFEAYRQRRTETLSKRKRRPKPSAIPRIFSNNCKQGIPEDNKIYCCILKEDVHNALCKACPCYEKEPVEYSQFKRE